MSPACIDARNAVISDGASFVLSRDTHVSFPRWTKADNIVFMKTVAEITTTTTNRHQQPHLPQEVVVFSEARTRSLNLVVCLAALEEGIHSSNLLDPICSRVLGGSSSSSSKITRAVEVSLGAPRPQLRSLSPVDFLQGHQVLGAVLRLEVLVEGYLEEGLGVHRQVRHSPSLPSVALEARRRPVVRCCEYISSFVNGNYSWLIVFFRCAVEVAIKTHSSSSNRSRHKNRPCPSLGIRVPRHSNRCSSRLLERLFPALK